MWGRSGFINTASAVVALVLVAVGAVQPPAVADNVDFVFPDAQEMREMFLFLACQQPVRNPTCSITSAYSGTPSALPGLRCRLSRRAAWNTQ